MGTKIIGIRLTLTLAVGIFLLTALLFAAAMIIANALSIPEPTARLLPFSARGLPETGDDASLANDIRSGRAESKGEPVPTVTAVPEPPRSGAPMVSSGGGDERATQTRPTIHRWVTSGNRSQADRAPSWWNQIPRAPVQPGSTPSSNPTPRVPPWRSPGYRPTEPQPTETEPTEPQPTEPQPSEPEPTASEPTGSEPTEPLASESATE
jgi:hypothetical protein